MVVPHCRVVRRYCEDVPAVIFTEADNPQDGTVLVWACRDVLTPADDVVLAVPPGTEMTDVEALLDAGYTVRLARPAAIGET